MDELYARLEAQVKALIQQCDSLKKTNSKLKQSQALLVREKDMLLTRHKTAIAQVEKMVSRLKSLEKPL